MTEKDKKDKSQRPNEEDSSALAVPDFRLPGIFGDIMRPFDEWTRFFFPQGTAKPFWTEQFGEREPVIDLQDRGDHYLLTAEFPGFDKRDIEVRVDQNGFELKAEKRSQKESRSSERSEGQSTFSYFQRHLTLPEKVVSEKVKGTMKNGVLELRLPKKEPTDRDNFRRVDLK